MYFYSTNIQDFHANIPCWKENVSVTLNELIATERPTEQASKQATNQQTNQPTNQLAQQPLIKRHAI